MPEKKIKILFVHPPAMDESILGGLKYPPMGIAFLSATVRENGYPVKIFDGNVEKDPLPKLETILKEYQPDIVGLSFTSLLEDSAHKTAELVKKINNNIVVITGGYHSTVKPLELIKDKNIDFVAVGEGELTLLEWLKMIESGQKNFEQIKGLVFKKNNQIIETPKRELMPSLDILPFPAYDLLPIDKYSSLASTRKPYITFVRSRGCPFFCTFCGVQKMFGRHYRCQSPQKTMSEIKTLIDKFGIKEINFKDSDFLINKNNVEELCHLLIEKKYDLIWTCNARVDMINEKIVTLMKQAGCSMITFGVESGNQEILDALKKGITLDQVRKAAKITQKVKIKSAFDMIIGGPGETKETVEKTIQFLKETDPDYAAFTTLTAFPGSELYDRAIENNWFTSQGAIDYDYEKINFNATKMSNKELEEAHSHAIKSFYLRPKYILKRLRYLTWGDIKNNFKGLGKILKHLVTK